MTEHERLRRLLVERLRDTRPALDASGAFPGGLTPEADQAIREHFTTAPIAAAVLVPIIDRADGLSILLTQRASHLRNHPGQISFPGGRIEPQDSGPVAAALRETEEEIGLARERVCILGYLDPYLVLTGYWITPVVGLVQPQLDLRLDHSEVAATFELPLSHLLDPANHRSRERVLGNVTLHVHDIPFEEHNIWGATAGILMSLYRLVQGA